MGFESAGCLLGCQVVDAYRKYSEALKEGN